MASLVPPEGMVVTPELEETLTAMLHDHAFGHDLCVVGDKGGGKSAVVQAFADRLGYVTETLSLYKDMTARDLLQRRGTDPVGLLGRPTPFLDRSLPHFPRPSLPLPPPLPPPLSHVPPSRSIPPQTVRPSGSIRRS